MKKIPQSHRNYTMTISVLFTFIVIKIPSPVFSFHDRDCKGVSEEFRFGQFKMLKDILFVTSQWLNKPPE